MKILKNHFYKNYKHQSIKVQRCSEAFYLIAIKVFELFIEVS
jgi:hypothetical protein